MVEAYCHTRLREAEAVRMKKSGCVVKERYLGICVSEEGQGNGRGAKDWQTAHMRAFTCEASTNESKRQWQNALHARIFGKWVQRLGRTFPFREANKIPVIHCSFDPFLALRAYFCHLPPRIRFIDLRRAGRIDLPPRSKASRMSLIIGDGDGNSDIEGMSGVIESQMSSGTSGGEGDGTLQRTWTFLKDTL